MSFSVAEVRPDDLRALAEIDALLAEEGLRRERGLDCICAAYDEEGRLAATGSCFGNSLRCLAVGRAYRGKGLLNQLLARLIRIQFARGNTHLFVCTKSETAGYFAELGFYEIARAEGGPVLLENRRDGFAAFLRGLEGSRRAGRSAALVMNANPFTLGHQYLAEAASAACDALHIFVLSEEAGPIPAGVRRRLVEAGTAHLPNAAVHDTGSYLVSRATFPGYFLQDEDAVTEAQARLDLAVFVPIARALGVSARYVGAEPESRSTGIYNEIMARELPRAGIACFELPRKELNGVPISAGRVRRLLRAEGPEAVRALVPESTFAYFESAEAAPVLQRLRASEEPPRF